MAAINRCLLFQPLIILILSVDLSGFSLRQPAYLRYIFCAFYRIGSQLLRVCLLASGSKGNSLFIKSGESRILVDAGLSGREIESRLNQIGEHASDLSAILVTHEHRDHITAVGPLARRHKLPVYVHPQTHAAMPNPGRFDWLNEFDVSSRFSLRDMEVTPFPITHDASEPVGFFIATPEGNIGVATDLGIATRLVAEQLKRCRVLVLESNHDEIMLRDGPYPWPLKQRIAGHHGHLSNTAAAELLDSLLWDGLEAVFLAHLSETNNDPQLAHHSAHAVLGQQNFCAPKLTVGSQGCASFCFETE
jgi:phosphoribosyl 1,2-cyclic phosphodiesterase